MATDNFNRADGGLGANWTTLDGHGAPQISSQVVVWDGASDSGAFYSGASFADDQYSQVKVVASANYYGVLARANNTDSGYAYMWFCTFAAGDTYRVYKYVNGSWSQIGSDYTITPPTAQNDTIKIEVSGTTITPYRNATAYTTQSDSAVSSGSSGLRLNVTAQIDDWEGGDLVTGVEVSAGCESLAITTYKPTVNAETSFTATCKSLTLSTKKATVNLNVSVQAKVVNLTLTEKTATINAETNISVETRALLLQVFSATINVGLAVRVILLSDGKLALKVTDSFYLVLT